MGFFLSKKNANALKSAVWAVVYFVFFCLLFLWYFWFFPAASCMFLYLKSVKNSHSFLLYHNAALNLQEFMADFKITYTTDSAMKGVDIPGRPSAKSIKDALDVEVELWMAFLPRR